MKFLVDVCVGQAVVNYLVQKGHDAKAVSEYDCRMSDLNILNLGYKEGRILITSDKDFGKLTFQVGFPHAGVVRLPNLSRQKRLELLELVLNRYTEALKTQAIVTVKQRKVRVTHLS